MYTFQVKIKIFNKDNNLTHVDRIFEREYKVLTTALHISYEICRMLFILAFIEI